MEECAEAWKLLLHLVAWSLGENEKTFLITFNVVILSVLCPVSKPGAKKKKLDIFTRLWWQSAVSDKPRPFTRLEFH